MLKPEISQPRELWKIDGSYRDAYLQNATLSDWRGLFSLVRGQKHKFWLDSVETEMCEPEAIFNCSAKSSSLLTIYLGQAQMNCHFFSPDEIELDIDPEQVKGYEEHDAILKFFEQLSITTGKPVRITEESTPAMPHLEFEPSTGRWKIYEYPTESEA